MLMRNSNTSNSPPLDFFLLFFNCFSAPIQSVRLHQKVLCCSGGTKYFERGFPGRGRLEPVKLQDGTYALPYVYS